MLGSARIGLGDPRHDDAVRLGGLLAGAGWTIVTGGYGGLMAAVTRGAAAAGGHTVGLPMRAWRHLTPDPSCSELRWSASYAERFGHLLATQVAIALPGGVGTLAEASGVWAAAQTEPGAAQLVLVGPAWRALTRYCPPSSACWTPPPPPSAPTANPARPIRHTRHSPSPTPAPFP